jgi:hypothetical protein
MPKITFRYLAPVALLAMSLGLPAVAVAGDLSPQHKKELSVFGIRAMGLQVGVADITNVLSRAELNELVATGLNLNGHLCAQVVDMSPLKRQNTYEVSCIAYRGGKAKKSYVLEALKGIAFEQ